MRPASAGLVYARIDLRGEQEMRKAIPLLRKGSELVREKRWREAVEVYLLATEKDASDPRCWFGLGVCLFKVGNFGMARIALERARKMGHAKASRAMSLLEEAQRRSAAEGKGAKAAVAPSRATGPSAARPAVAAPPPRPLVRPEEEKIDLGRPIPIMLVEPVEADRQAIKRAIEGTIKNAGVASVPYTVSCANTLSKRVDYYAALLDWDAEPNAATGLTQILKIKRPEMLIICLTENWDPEKGARILETGADYHLVKSPHFASVLPLIIAQWARRDMAVLQQLEAQQAQMPSQRWPSCLDAVGEVMMLVDTDYTVLQANRAAAKLFEKDEADLIGQRYPVVLYGTEQPPESCPLLQVLQLEKPTSSRIYHAQSGKTLRFQGWPIVSDAGRVSAAIALLGEETAPEWAGEQPSGEAAGLASVLEEGVDRLQCGIAVLDAEGRITWINSLAADLLCADKDSLIGKDYVELLSQNLRDLMEAPEPFIEAVVTAHRTGESLEGHPFRLGDALEGTTLTYWSTPVPAGPSSSVWRIEHYYPSEAAPYVVPPLTADRQPVAQLVEAVGDLLFTTDAEGNITWSCPAAARTGYSEGELRGMPLADLAAPEARDKFHGLLEKTLAAPAGVSREEIAIAHADGKRRWAELTLLPIMEEEDEKPRGVQAILRDITDRKMTKAIRDILAGTAGP